MSVHPLSWDGDPARVPPDRPPGAVDIIVPVCGAADAFARCAESLLLHTDLERHRLTVVLDGPQPAVTGAVVERLRQARPDRVQVLENAERRGFVVSVNRAMSEPPGAASRDVVLLNSDTRVTARWLGKLQEAAYSAPEIATVTPFSNSATICSLPRFLETNALPAGWDADAFGRLVESRSRHAWPRLPTGVGVCLYIKRKALEQVGLFDDKVFGEGYGEESEWCMRALKAGYAHVLDDATFIFHEGQRSFGASRDRRVRAAHRAMRRLHPEYLATIAAFIREDPIRPLRQRVLAELRPARGFHLTGQLSGRPERVLHLVHGWPPWSPAGTELYAAWLARRQARLREVAVYARIPDPERAKGETVELLDGGVRVRLVVNNFTQRDPLSRNALRDRDLEADFARFLDALNPRLLHVHHLAGHTVSLVGVAARRGIPILYQVQDWWAPCARANLLDAGRHLCSGPGAGKCSACLPLTRLPPAPLLNRALYAYRAAAVKRALRKVDAFVMGSEFIRQSYLDLGYLWPEAAVSIIPYGVEVPASSAGSHPPVRPPRIAGAPLRFGMIGSILPHKGVHLAVAAFAGIDPARATLAVWGDPSIDPDYTRELTALCGPGTEMRGRFADEEKPAVFATMDVLLLPSLGLESFGLVAREAMLYGVPVLASDRGALSDLLEGGEGGALFDPDDPAALRSWVERLIADPATVDRWAARLPAIKSADAHAEEIEEVYDRIVAQRAMLDRTLVGVRRGGRHRRRTA
jgi:glycosyltransferase involved in cell wall biosynthesis/GT2 family glycosyltransferase